MTNGSATQEIKMSSPENMELKNLSLGELRIECSKRGLKKTGNRPLLIARIQESIEYEKEYENEVTRCICEFTHEDGSMISCDKCM